jgi:hypothetical protein
VWLFLQLGRGSANEGSAHVECDVHRNKHRKFVVFDVELRLFSR